MKKYIYTLVLICGFILTTKAQSTPPFGPVDCDTYYYDLDRDGFGGQTLYTGSAIVTPEFRELNKLVCNSSDCDDTNPQINPNTNWAVLVDSDGDGLYVIGSVEKTCVPTDANAVLIGEDAILENFSYLQLDCDDTNSSLGQSALYYQDSDGDGFGDIESIILSCSGSTPAGYVENAGDSCPDTYGLYNGCPDVTTNEGINQNKNYVHTTAYQTPLYLVEVATAKEQDKQEQVTYFDGMGRAQMQVAIGQSPKDRRDIKTIISYDSYGRANTQFLPYVGTQKGGGFVNRQVGGNPNTNAEINQEIKEQQQFYHNKYHEDVQSFTTSNGGLTMLNNLENIPEDLLDAIATNTPDTGLLYPSYSTNVYDEIDRPTQTAAPGKDWSLEFNHTIKMEYDLNDSIVDAVRRFDISNTGTLVDTNQYYSTGTLYKTVTKDENWQPGQAYTTDHTTEEFKNKSGQVLLKRTYDGGNILNTYYVYDDFGNLTYVLPPVASAQANIFANDVINKFCYQYKYDHRNRLIEKRIPGKDWEYIVYDVLDRPVLTQDVNLRNDGLWLFTKYDALGRVVYTGKYTSSASRISLQNSVTANTILNETRTTTATFIGDSDAYYSNSGFPTTGLELLSVNYYDDYLWDTGTSYEANYNIETSVGITATGIEHKKPSGLSASWTNSGLTTQGVIQGDGYIQYTITETDNKRVMVGLSHQATATPIHYSSINYRIYTGFGTDKRVRVYKDANLESFPNTYCAVGDTFRVERSGNQILFKKNGVTFHAVTSDYTGTLVGDACFYDPETAIENVYIGYSVMGQAFTSNTKGLATGGKLRVLDTKDWITSVAYYDEKGRTIHSSSKNDYLRTSDAVSSLLDFSGKVLKTNTTHAQKENAPIVTNDEYIYGISNRLLYQTKQINGGSKELIARNHYDELGQLIQKQVGGSLPLSASMENLVNITQDGDKLTKTSANAWDGGVNTTNIITGDGYVSYKLPQSTRTLIVGLSDVAGDNSFQSIKYGIYTASNGGLHIRENGVTTWNVSSYVGGDTFKIERRGKTIYYLKNNQIFHISEIVDTGANLLGDVAMFHINAEVKDLVLVDLEKELQEVDYTYNVRGWLTGINDVDNPGDDLFSFGLKYNDIADPTKKLFNGNISSTLWRSKGADSSLKDYIYDYDPLNRIISAVDNTGNYNLDNVGYDLNGNIKSLQRSGHRNEAATIFGVMDQLVYEYNGNQLEKVTDATGIEFGFKDGTNTDDDYSYDANGNMISDKNKGITSIAYNHLNLPTQITFDNSSSISYIYDASGVKQQKIVNDQQEETLEETYYAGNYIYKKANASAPVSLTFFNSEEGYIEPEFDASKPNTFVGFNYTYQYKDHLGNIRLAYEDLDGNGSIDPLTEIKEENHYYPFGLKHKGYNNGITGRNHQYGYGGKEEQSELGLEWIDITARNYDASLGRWMNIDPHAETYYSLSSYQAMANNPISFIDPDGKDILFWQKNEKTKKWQQVTFDKLSEETQEALKAFVSTKEGKAFLSDFAKEGDKIGDVEFTKDGKYSKHEVAIGDFSFYGGEDAGAEMYFMETGENRIRLALTFNNAYNLDKVDDGVNPMVSRAITFGHEAFIHFTQYMTNILDAFEKGDLELAKKLINERKITDSKNFKLTRKEHGGYLDGKPEFQQMRAYLSQLRKILNPEEINKALKRDTKAVKTIRD
jgi:RHS repeat-associated protein